MSERVKRVAKEMKKQEPLRNHPATCGVYDALQQVRYANGLVDTVCTCRHRATQPERRTK